MLFGLQRAALEKRQLLVEYARVTGRTDVLNGAIGEPDHIIADASANALPGRAWGDRRQPPVLQIPLDELPSAGAQQMLPGKIRPRDGQRHSVLQLIAKAVCAAGL